MLRNTCRPKTWFVHILTIMLCALVMWGAIGGFRLSPVSQHAFAQDEPDSQFGDYLIGDISIGNVDTFTVEAIAGDIMTIRAIDIACFGGDVFTLCDCFEPIIALRDQNDVLVSQNRMRGVARIGAETLPQDGLYKIEVFDDFSNCTGRYGLFFQRTNTPGQAVPLAFGDDFLVFLNNPGEVDTYTFTAQAGERVLIDMIRGDVSNILPQLELYDSVGRPLEIAGRPRIDHTLTSDGTFTVLAFSLGTETGTYRIRLAKTPSPVSGSVAGFTPTSAICRNDTTEQSVTIQLDGETSWNCEQAGLIVNVDDSVFTSAEGSAVEPPLPRDVLGIFSETAREKLTPGTDAFIGTFFGGNAVFNEDDFVEDSDDVQEGTVSLRSTVSVNASGGGFAGWFVSWGREEQAGDHNVVRDMSAFASGKLLFWVKSSIDLEVGIRSGNVSAGSETSKLLLSQVDGFASDNTWQRLCIPLSTFAGSAPKADLRQMKVFFVVAANTPTGGTGGQPQTFLIDDVRWESTSCP